jgi:hypothetical protein
LNNFGVKAGVVYTSNDGYAVFNNCTIINNKALYSSILVTLSSPSTYTEFSNSYIYNNSLLDITDFLNITDGNNSI